MCSQDIEMHLHSGEITTTKMQTTLNIQKHVDLSQSSDTRELRQQLEKYRAALRLQSQRQRQLVAAYTTKLRDKENELRETERRSDARLANIVRALLALEANMKREQKTIKAQLSEKDKVIYEQRSIISALIKSTGSSNSECSSSSSPLSSQNTSVSSSSCSPEHVTLKHTLSVFENTINIEQEDKPSGKENQVPPERPAKPPKPPKPHTPYKPILKLSVAKDIRTTKRVNTTEVCTTQKVTSEEVVVRTTRRANSEVCLLLAPTRSPTSTQHLHPAQPTVDPNQNNKVVSPHRVSRMVQRFEPRTAKPRSLSCTALSSLKLSPLNNQNSLSDDCLNNKEIEQYSERLFALNSQDKDDKVEYNLELLSLKNSLDSLKNNEDSLKNKDESDESGAELYSLSSNDDKNSLKDNAFEEDTLRGNFEEFHLDSGSSSEDEGCSQPGRREGDGAEKSMQPPSNNPKLASSYEGFLEATGLSQKSILTPSRLSIASNPHRSVLKPRHVKFRSKANRTFVTPTVKYWSGPFL